MDTKDYHLWKQIQAQFKIEMEKKGDQIEAEKIDSEEELEDDVFEAVSKRAWTDILLQIYKVSLKHNSCIIHCTQVENTVMILSFRTPKTFVVITLKFELCGFTID